MAVALAAVAPLHFESDLPVDYVPVLLDEKSDAFANMAGEDRTAVFRVLAQLVAASRHRRVLAPEDTAATVRDSAAENVRYGVIAHLDAKPRAYYEIIITYPLTLAVTFVDLSHVYGAEPRFLDVNEMIGPMYDPTIQRMVMTLHLMTRASGQLPGRETVVYYAPQEELHVAAHYGGLGVRRAGGSAGGGVGSAANSPLRPAKRQKREHEE